MVLLQEGSLNIMHHIKKINKIDNIINKYPNIQKSDLGKILAEIQNEFGFLTEDIIKRVSVKVGVSATEAYGYASFYSIYKLKKPGKYIINVCKGTACHVKGAQRLIDDLMNYLNVKEGETTKDRLFTLDLSACLGVCALSPVMMINDKTYTRVNFKIAKSLLEEIRKKETTNNNENID